MKKSTVITVMAAAMVAVALAADQKPVRRGPPRRPAKPSGGIVEKQMASKVLRVRDTAQLLPADKMDSLTRDIRYSALLPIELVRGERTADCALKAAESLVAEKNVAAGVLVVKDEKLPIFLSAADRNWTILNVGPLVADSPAADKLQERFTKVYWMAVARTLGAGYSSYPGCVLVPFSNIRELDAIKVLQPCPEPFNKMLDTGHALGMKTLSIASYRTACQQGWAPAPTNDVQKAIWDEVHKLPTTPIKIEPETKKVRE